jgi:hypothetical protein
MTAKRGQHANGLRKISVAKPKKTGGLYRKADMHGNVSRLAKWQPTGAPCSPHGPKTSFSNAFTPCVTRILPLASVFARIAGALGGAAPRPFRPMYAGANMGHRAGGCEIYAQLALWVRHQL